ncbi:MAG: DUF5320 domain-containing protein [Clostridia bacterium]|nr:DUF5320 domain-containing protein [Clostridia bacterium]MCI2000512.1 DUF5320 domain-containing protein [Clostridia bacterium]MCI2014967.1 DUF5320 domain-containing protein [Clostridia bacterium]
MPRRNGTGPMEMGPMTGRKAGYCAGFAEQGYDNHERIGCGFGRGHGYRRMYYLTGLPRWARSGYDETYEPSIDEKKLLNQQEEFLVGQLEKVKKRISDLSKDAE